MEMPLTIGKTPKRILNFRNLETGQPLLQKTHRLTSDLYLVCAAIEGNER
jgi:hypothetical protein